jgi:DNA-binding transcriptional ArsR family regulator
VKELMAITKALADESRTRVLMSLGGGELCVCQIMELLGLAPSTVSKHLTVLHQAGLVESRKEGRWIYYSLPDKKSAPCAYEALRWLRGTLASDERIAQDAKRLKAIRKMSKHNLCARYKA